MKVIVCLGFFKDLKRFSRQWWYPSRLWYSFKCWAWKRFTTVKPRYLGHTWCDRCELLPHVMFEVLSHFIENECNPGDIEWYGEHGRRVTVNGEERYVRDELQQIYDWWHKTYHHEYPERENALLAEQMKCKPISCFTDYDDDGDFSGCVWDPQYASVADKIEDERLLSELQSLEKHVEAERADMLHRLVNVHQWMWT